MYREVALCRHVLNWVTGFYTVDVKNVWCIITLICVASQWMFYFFPQPITSICMCYLLHFFPHRGTAVYTYLTVHANSFICNEEKLKMLRATLSLSTLWRNTPEVVTVSAAAALIGPHRLRLWRCYLSKNIHRTKRWWSTFSCPVLCWVWRPLDPLCARPECPTGVKSNMETVRTQLLLEHGAALHREALQTNCEW